MWFDVAQIWPWFSAENSFFQNFLPGHVVQVDFCYLHRKLLKSVTQIDTCSNSTAKIGQIFNFPEFPSGLLGADGISLSTPEVVQIGDSNGSNTIGQDFLLLPAVQPSSISPECLFLAFNQSYEYGHRFGDNPCIVTNLIEAQYVRCTVTRKNMNLAVYLAIVFGVNLRNLWIFKKSLSINCITF